MVNSSSSCCKLSRHSRSASEISSSSLGEIEVVDPADEEGRESTSSSVLAGGMFAYEKEGSDIVALRSAYRALEMGVRFSCNGGDDFKVQ